LIQKIVGSEQLSDEEVVRLEQSLETLGLSKDLSKAVTKVVTQQELSDQEVTAVKDYIVAADLSDEEVVSVLDQIRLPEHKIIEYMEKLDYSEETIQRLLDKKKE
jgi:anthranilate phosphoribosyltransferase